MNIYLKDTIKLLESVPYNPEITFELDKDGKSLLITFRWHLADDSYGYRKYVTKAAIQHGAVELLDYSLDSASNYIQKIVEQVNA